MCPIFLSMHVLQVAFLLASAMQQVSANAIAVKVAKSGENLGIEETGMALKPLNGKAHHPSTRPYGLNCINFLKPFFSNVRTDGRNGTLMVLTGRVEDILYIQADGVLKTLPAHVDVEGCGWRARPLYNAGIYPKREENPSRTPIFAEVSTDAPPQIFLARQDEHISLVEVNSTPGVRGSGGDIEEEESADESLNLEISPRPKRFVGGQRESESEKMPYTVFDNPVAPHVTNPNPSTEPTFNRVKLGRKSGVDVSQEGKGENGEKKYISEEAIQREVRKTRMGAQVRVKRVIKGDRALEDTLILIDGIIGPRLLSQHHLCPSRLRVKDSRIFVVHVEEDGCMVLAFPPFPVTLENLREFNKLTRHTQPDPNGHPSSEENVHETFPAESRGKKWTLNEESSVSLGNFQSEVPSEKKESRTCECNKLGAVSGNCDVVNPQECKCRVGVGGTKCDRCLPGFWGLSKSAGDAHSDGCTPCCCSRFGSVRDDCEQMTGRCVCRRGVLGHKCNSCPVGEFLGPHGCTLAEIVIGKETPIHHWISTQLIEPQDEGQDSLGLDDVVGRTSGEIIMSNMGTLRLSSSSVKSSRHVPPEWKDQKIYSKNFYPQAAYASAAIQMRSYLGESCEWNADCGTAHSVCANGSCICGEGFYEDSDRTQCKPVEEASLFFSGRSRISTEKLGGYHKLSLELEITPYLDYQHGILIFSSEHTNGSGDFLSLTLIDGFVEFRYDLGDGPAVLRSSSRVLSGSTHSIVAKRYKREGLLRVEGDEDVQGTSPGTMKSLNVDHGGYMGHVPLNSTKMRELVGTAEGFVGCIHKLIVGRRSIELNEKKRDPLIKSRRNVLQCPIPNPLPDLGESTTPIVSAVPEARKEERGERNYNQISSPLKTVTTSGAMALNSWDKKLDVCSRIANPCKNDGICWNDRSSVSLGYKCVCRPQFRGQHCESRTLKIEESGAMVDFRGLSYLELPRIENAGRHVSIEIWFMSREMDGLILYTGQDMGKGDFLTILVSNGFLQFLFDLGSGMGDITYTQPISLDKWHWLVATSDGRGASLQIDGQVLVTGKSPPALSELNLELPLYVGGIRDMNIVHRQLGVLPPFNGVLQFLRVNGETYHADIITSIQRRLVRRYEGPPCGTRVSPPCNNKGSCFPRLDYFVCLCQPQYLGKTCENRQEAEGPVRFNGQSYIKFPQKVAKKSKAERRNRIEIVFRTTSTTSGVILWTGQNSHSESNSRSRKGYLGIFLVDGYVELRVDLGAGRSKGPTVMRSRVKVADGSWHQVLVARQKRLIVLQVDGAIPQRATAPPGSNVLLSDGRYWIGGTLPSILPGTVPSSLHQGFVGCVDLVQIQTRRLPLSKIAHSTGVPFCGDED